MFNGLANAVNQSLLTRFLANIFLFAVLMSVLLVTVLQAIGLTHVDLNSVNPMALTILGVGLGQAIQLLGLNVGVTLQPMQSKKTPTTTLPPTP